jgi:hypothetical protein
LFMSFLEQRFLKGFHEQHNCQPLVYLRYIDDIFIVWTGSREHLSLFISKFNEFHPSIKFSHNVSSQSISFLDVLVTLGGDNKFKTSLYKKPTDNPCYVHFTSDHPRHVPRSLPYSLALRCQRICSDPTDAKNELTNLKEKFAARGYPTQLLNDACTRAAQSSRPRNRIRRNVDTVNFITMYNSRLPNIRKILHKHHSILLSNPRTEKIFGSVPRVVFKRPKNLRDYLVKAKVTTTPPSHLQQGCAPCKRARCKVCTHMVCTSAVVSRNGRFKFKIQGSYDCKTSNAVYLLECSLCGAQYLGQTKTSFNLRFNNHKSHCSVLPDLPISRHCNMPGHGIEQFKTTILKAGFRSDTDRLAFESYLIQCFDALNDGINENCGFLPPLL